jgi:DNA topoisomerase VI subunit A
MSQCLLCCCAVVASEKGVVVGRLTFIEDGDNIDCKWHMLALCIAQTATETLLALLLCSGGV